MSDLDKLAGNYLAIKGLYGDRAKGKVAIVTGASAGLGYETSKALAFCGAHVIMASRNLEKTQKAAVEVKEEAKRAGSDSPVEATLLDLTKLSTVKEFVDNFKGRKLPLDILVCNASAWMTPDDMSPTPEGFEYQTASFFYGHMYLTELLKDLLIKSQPSRLIWTGSAAESYGTIDWDDLKAEHKTSDFKVYGTSKLMGMMCAREYTSQLKSKGVEVYCGQPGMSSTDFFNPDKFDVWKPSATIQWAMQKAMALTAEQGALPLIYCCLAPSSDLHDAGDGSNYGPEYYTVGGDLGQKLLGGAPQITNKGLIRVQEPQNPELKDAAACKKLYEKTIQILKQAPGAEGI